MSEKLREFWKNAVPTGCPYQNYYEDSPIGFWVSEEVPPCKKKICNKYHCHNFGKKFIEPKERWLLIPGWTRK